MRTFLLLVATLVVFTASTFVLPVVVHGEHGHGGHAGGGKHAGGRGPIARHKAAGPRVKATGKHHHKLKPPKPPKPPKPVKTGGLLHPFKKK